MVIDSNHNHNGEKWINVTPSNPCPICKHGDWCFISQDGRYVGCRREGRFDGEHRIDAAGCDYWLYDLSGESGHIAAQPPPAFPQDQEQPSRADVELLNKIYRALLDKLTLSPEHRENLQKRGLPDEEIDRRGYRTWPKSGRAAIAKQLSVQFGDPVLKTIPGIYLKSDVKDNSIKFWSLAGGAGLAIPVRDDRRRVIGIRIRLDNPSPGWGKYIWLSSAKHNGPSPGSPLHFPGFDDDLSIQETIRITEGELKADIATVLSNVFTLSLPGVLNWRSVFNHLDKFPALNTAKIAFDADAPKNIYVATALKELALALSAKDYNVEIEIWDFDGGKGIDDVLAAQGNITLITGEHVGPRLEEILETAKRSRPPVHVRQLDEAKRKIDVDHLAERLESPEFLNDRDILEALAFIKKLSPGDWMTQIKPVLRSKGIVRDVEQLVSKHKLHDSKKPNSAHDKLCSSLPSDHRPIIITNNRDLHEASVESIDLLVASNTPPSLFLRSGEIIRVGFDENHEPIIGSVDARGLRQRLAECGKFVESHEGGMTKVNPPMPLCENILEFPSFPFPGLEGVVEIPIARPDGMICLTPGYDPATRLYYARHDELASVTVQDSPDQDSITKARYTIIDLLYDFPFVDQSSFANTVALLISPFIRHIYEGCSPLAIIDAPKGGSGKSLLARIISIIATGQKAAVLCAPETDAEWRKKITSTLATGKTIIILDNVETSLWAPALEAVLTTTLWEDRELGKTKNVRLPQRATWIATGNNIQLRRALPRRCYQIRINPMTDKPEEIDGFRHPELETYAKRNRARIVAAVLTLIRSWFAAGSPVVKIKPLGGFEDWARILHGILHHAGIEGFLGNRAELYQAADEEGMAWEGFLAEWYFSLGDRTVKVNEIVEKIENDESLRNALPAVLLDAFLSPNGSFRKKFGVSLSRKRDTQYGEYCLQMRGQDNHDKQKTWGVQKIDAGLRVEAGRFLHQKNDGFDKKDDSTEFLREDGIELPATANHENTRCYSTLRDDAGSHFNPEDCSNIIYTHAPAYYMCAYGGVEISTASTSTTRKPTPPNGIPDDWLTEPKSWPESTRTLFAGYITAYKDNRIKFAEIERAFTHFHEAQKKRTAHELHPATR